MERRARGRGKGKLFNGDGMSVPQGETGLGTDDGHGSTAACTRERCRTAHSLKNGQDGRLYAACISTQFLKTCEQRIWFSSTVKMEALACR